MVKGYETLVGSGEHGHDRGSSVARMIASRAAATRMVDMIVKWIAGLRTLVPVWQRADQVIWQIAIINAISLLRCP